MMLRVKDKSSGLVPKVREKSHPRAEKFHDDRGHSTVEKGKTDTSWKPSRAKKKHSDDDKGSSKSKKHSKSEKSTKKTDKKCASKVSTADLSDTKDDSDLDDDDPNKVYRGSTGLAVMNLSSRVLITILIAIPYALREAGFGLGVILIIVIGFLSDYTLGLLIEAAEITEETTYIGIVRKTFGRFGVSGVVFKQFFYPFLLMVASNVLIADVLVKIVILIADENDLSGVVDNFYGRREFIITVATGVITFPLSLYRNIGYLSKWAAFSFALMITLMIFVIVRLNSLDLPNTPGAYTFAMIDVGRSIGILIAAFMVQHSSFMIFESMLLNDNEHQLEVAHISISLSALVAMLFGVLGYATFTQNTQANLLNNYCTDDTLMNVGRVLFVLSVILAFPGEVIVARTVIELTLFKNLQPPPLWRHVLLTFIIVFASVGVSFLTDCLSIYLELNGVTNAAPLAFVIPPMLILKLDKKRTRCQKVPLYIVLMLGSAVTVFGIVLSIKSIIEGIECTHGAEPVFCTAMGNGGSDLVNTTSIVNVTSFETFTFFENVTILIPATTV